METSSAILSPTLEEKLNRLPDRPGVYQFKDAKGQVIYIGKGAPLALYASRSHRR